MTPSKHLAGVRPVATLDMETDTEEDMAVEEDAACL